MRFPRSSGILLHPTSLPGPYGSGDLGSSAYHFVDWLVSAGQTMWQILPLGGIGPGNSPYMSSSAFAGNVLLIDLKDLHAHGWLLEEELSFEQNFNAHNVDYPLIKQFRMDKLRIAAQRFMAKEQEYLSAFEIFCDEEKLWLDDYALFMALTEKFPNQDWCNWDAKLARRDEVALLNARVELSEEIDFWRFCQWCFFGQWGNLKRYANERGIQIIGDMPIFIAYQSADVWSRPDLFQLDKHNQPLVVAGVPPDYFSATGQRWGNPIYRWQTHEQEDYSWWTERLKKKMELVDIIRIDHFRGFAAYWEISANEATAINGRWMPGPGEKLFKAIQKSLGKLPIIAEDLGVITPDVVALLEKFDLPGMRVLQFAFGGSADNPYLPHNYIRNTVVYSGTHDNDTTLGWFASAPQHERSFACKYLRTDGKEIHWNLIHAASQSVADVAIHTMQDVLGLGTEHRMNMPGKAEGYWEWRFSWEQVAPFHADQLYEISVVHGRCVANR